MRTFCELSDRVGVNRVIWRYDPIVFTALTSTTFHRDNFQRIAASLRDHTRRSVISIVDSYRKTERRLRKLEGTPAAVQACDPEDFRKLMCDLAQTAADNGINIVSCAEEIDLRPFGIRPGKCIDPQVIADAFQLDVPSKKDPTQREACGCALSRDIGMYESCLFGCQYCYATKSFEQAKVNFDEHDPPLPPSSLYHGTSLRPA